MLSLARTDYTNDPSITEDPIFSTCFIGSLLLLLYSSEVKCHAGNGFFRFETSGNRLSKFVKGLLGQPCESFRLARYVIMTNAY